MTEQELLRLHELRGIVKVQKLSLQGHIRTASGYINDPEPIGPTSWMQGNREANVRALRRVRRIERALDYIIKEAKSA